MLWIALGLLAVTLVLIRNAYGALAVLATGVLVAYAAGWATPRVQDGFAAAMCWFLLFGGLRATRELRPRRGGASDADMLAGLTHLPGGMWRGIFWLTAGVAADRRGLDPAVPVRGRLHSRPPRRAAVAGRIGCPA